MTFAIASSVSGERWILLFASEVRNTPAMTMCFGS
jgi:hypothetical protein